MVLGVNLISFFSKSLQIIHKQIKSIMHFSYHTVNFCKEMGLANHVSEKNIFFPMNVYKSRGKKNFKIVHWPFDLPPKQHRPTGPFGWHKWSCLAWSSKRQCTISKILSSLIFSLFIKQNIFFPETCFAFTISEPKFKVCVKQKWRALPVSTK